MSAVTIPLNTDRLVAVFYKKQDYEPFAVPMGYPVLEDINWKQGNETNGYGGCKNNQSGHPVDNHGLQTSRWRSEPKKPDGHAKAFSKTNQ